VCTYVVREHAQDLRTRVETGVHCTSGVSAWCYARSFVQLLQRVVIATGFFIAAGYAVLL